VRALSRSGNGETELSAPAPGLHRVEIPVS
jgi:hypothetical protein